MESIPNEWNIIATIGPIVFHVYVDSTFFGSETQHHIERHTHSAYEFHFILGGTGTVHTDNAEYKISTGCYYIVKPGVYHKHTGYETVPIHKCSFRFEFDIDSKNNKEYSDQEIRNIIYVFSSIELFLSSDSQYIMKTINEIQDELKRKPVEYYSKTQLLFSLLFIQMVREVSITNNESNTISDFRKPQDNRNTIIEAFFDINSCCSASSKDLCKLAHISKSQLNRILNQRYGMSYKKKQIETRIERIKDMLSNTDMAICEISEAIGYSSECNFSAFFKRVTGTSPKQYRKESRK